MVGNVVVVVFFVEIQRNFGFFQVEGDYRQRIVNEDKVKSFQRIGEFTVVEVIEYYQRYNQRYNKFDVYQVVAYFTGNTFARLVKMSDK